MYTLAVLGALLMTGSEAAADAAPPTGHEALSAPAGETAVARHATPPAAPQPVPSARVWIEEGLDHFYPGDHVNLRFRTSEDAYVAIVHVDTEGMLDLVYPTSRWDQEFVRGMRTYSVPFGGRGSYHVSRSPGIGYFYIIASRHPLDLGFFFGHAPLQHPLFGHGRYVRGDPFWVLDQLSFLLVRDAVYGRFATDIYSYHVGGVHRYPTFACYDRFSSRAPLSGYPFYTSCFELQRLLTRYPHYYDTRRFRGNRAVFVRELDRLAPLHGFKERPDLPGTTRRFADPGPADVRARGVLPTTPRAEPSTVPARQRPTLERRPEPRSEDPRGTSPAGGETPTRATPARTAPTRDQSEAESRGQSTPPTRATPAREQPRAQPQSGRTPTRAAPERQQPSATGRSTGSAAPARGSGAAPARTSGASTPTRAAPAGRARSN